MCLKSAYLHEGEYDLVIVDEVHRALSKEYRKLFTSIKTKALLCLTATLPEDPEYVSFLERIAPTVYEKELSGAIDEGLAPKAQIYNLAVPLSKEVAGKYKVFDSKFTQSIIKLTRFRSEQFHLREYSSIFELARAAQHRNFEKEVQMACNAYWASMTMRKQVLYENPAKIGAVISILEKYPPSAKWIIFTKTTAFAEKIATQVPNSVVYHSKQKTSQREQVLKAFSAGDKTRLIAVDALNEGLDVPRVFGGICASGVSTLLTNRQQLGRIIRPEEGKTPIFFNLYTIGTVEKTWIEKKFINSKLTPIWLNHLAEVQTGLRSI